MEKQLDFKSNAFDFIRLSLALIVVFSHSFLIGGWGSAPHVKVNNEDLSLGSFAVYGFFILSGILIFKSAISSTNILSYTKKRFLRIFPGLWATLILIAFVFMPIIYIKNGVGYIDYLKQYGFDIIKYIFNNGVVFFYGKSRNIGSIVQSYPAGEIGAGEIAGSFWTLAFELKVYMLAAIIAFTGLFKRKFAVPVIFFIFWIIYINLGFEQSIITRIVHKVIKDDHNIVLSTYFLAGSVAFQFIEKIKLNYKFFAISIILTSLSLIYKFFPVVGPFTLTYILLFSGTYLPFTDIAKKYGDLSYGVYVYSFPIQVLLYTFGFQSFGFIAYTSISIILSLIFGYISYHLVEKRFITRSKLLQ